MDRKKVIRISWYVLTGVLTLFTIMFFFDIKFVVMGINILVLDALTAGIWIFACLCKWAGCENTERRTVAVIAITLAGLFATTILLFGLAMYGGIYEYTEGTAKTPERILIEQLVDDDHDAFLIDTGGELGTLLITVETEESNESTYLRLILHFSVWDPAHMDTPLQTMTADSACFHWHHTLDANFDGYTDFSYTFAMGNMPYYDHLWIWDETQQQFVNIPEFDEISVPELDEETKTIYGYNRSSAGGTGLHTFHQWIGGNLLCMRRIEIEGWDSTVRMSVWDRVAGELAEIYHEDFPSDSYSWQDAQMVWYNLDYHGEPGGIYDIFMQQLIDDTHDAFLVSTGGKLGTLLITAELAQQSKGEFGTRNITFSVWNPAEMEQPIQTFTEEFMMSVASEFHDVVDANFDGFQYFGYLFHAGNQPNYWHYWLWDEEQEQFRYYAPLTEIPNSKFEEEQQVVTGWLRSGAKSGTHSLYRWIDEELTLVRIIKFDCFESDTQLITIEDWLDGKMATEYQREYKFDSEEYDLISQWFDLDYHGEPKEEN